MTTYRVPYKSTIGIRLDNTSLDSRIITAFLCFVKSSVRYPYRTYCIQPASKNVLPEINWRLTEVHRRIYEHHAHWIHYIYSYMQKIIHTLKDNRPFPQGTAKNLCSGSGTIWMDQYPAPDSNSSIKKQKKRDKPWFFHFCDFFNNMFSLKTDGECTYNKQKKTFNYYLLASWKPPKKKAGYGSGFVILRYGSVDPGTNQNVSGSGHCTKNAKPLTPRSGLSWSSGPCVWERPGGSSNRWSWSLCPRGTTTPPPHSRPGPATNWFKALLHFY